MEDRQRKKVLGIVGPSGVGKTDMGIKLCRLLDGEIISCDSRQIIRGLDIGTAKPSPQERLKTRHHLIDIIDIGEDFSAYRYRKMAQKVIDDILARNKQPIVVGGTGLYYKALLQGFFETPPKDERFRERLEREAEEYGNEYLWIRLSKIDPEASKSIPRADRVRIVRALEICHTTGIPKSELAKTGKYPEKRHKFITVGLNLPRQSLYSRINARVEEMLQAGWIEEMKSLIKVSKINSGNIKNIMGYNNLYQYINGQMNYMDCIEKIKQSHRNYAKRQITWFMGQKDIIWFNMEDQGLAENILELFNSQ